MQALPPNVVRNARCLGLSRADAFANASCNRNKNGRPARRSAIVAAAAEVDASTLPAPVDQPGHWVERKKFKGHKSFGYFRCGKCRKGWMSAHAFKQYRQDCNRCESALLPIFMWVNERHDDSDSKDREVRTMHNAHMRKSTALERRQCMRTTRGMHMH
eukprot:355943-Chlamydomonas_euryale.AAC.8